MKIKLATVQDIPEIVEVDKEAFGEGGIPDWMVKSQLKTFPSGIFVAKEKNKVIGIVCSERHQKEIFPPYHHDVSKFHTKKGKLFYLSVITIKEEFRNKGIGSLLLEKVSNLAKKTGGNKIYCPVNKKHPYFKNGVLRFWKKNGYQITGDAKWEVSSGKFLDSYVFTKNVGFHSSIT